MEDLNEDDLIMYEESKEIKETIWKIWDLLNDKELVTKLLLSSTLMDEIKKAQNLLELNFKENKELDKNKNNLETKGKLFHYSKF